MAQTTEARETPCKSGDYLRSGLRLFHDGNAQQPRMSKRPESLEVRADGFDGTYMSLVAELDPAAAQAISVGADLVARIGIETQQARPAYLRAHFSNEEGREILHDLIVIAEGPREVRFNLDGLRIPLELATSAWVDLVFPSLAGLQMTFSRFDLAIEDQ